MFGVLLEKQVAAPTASNLVLTDKGIAVDLMIRASCGLIQVSDKQVNISPSVVAVDIDTPDRSSVHFGGVLSFRRQVITILWGRG